MTTKIEHYLNSDKYAVKSNDIIYHIYFVMHKELYITNYIIVYLFDEKQNKESIFDDIDVKVGISGSLGNLSRIDGNGLIFSNNSLIGFVVFVFGFVVFVFGLSAIVLSAN